MGHCGLALHVRQPNCLGPRLSFLDSSVKLADQCIAMAGQNCAQLWCSSVKIIDVPDHRRAASQGHRSAFFSHVNNNVMLNPSMVHPSCMPHAPCNTDILGGQKCSLVNENTRVSDQMSWQDNLFATLSFSHASMYMDGHVLAIFAPS
jgi:hypothetical protein